VVNVVGARVSHQERTGSSQRMEAAQMGQIGRCFRGILSLIAELSVLDIFIACSWPIAPSVKLRVCSSP